MKIDLAAFIAGAAQTQIGLMQGRMAGEEIRRQREREQRAQRLQDLHESAWQLNQRHAAEIAEDEVLRGVLPTLDRASHNKAVGYLLRRARERSERQSQLGGYYRRLGLNVPEFPAAAALPAPAAPAAPATAPTPAPAPAQPAPAAPAAPAQPAPAAATPPSASAPALSPQHIEALKQIAPHLPGGQAILDAMGQLPQAPTPAAGTPVPSAPAAPATGAPSLTPAAPAEAPQTIDVPGLGPLQLGPDPKQVERLLKAAGERYSLLRDYRPKDAAERDAIAAELSGLPQDLQTPEDLAAVKRFLRNTTRFVPGSSPATQRILSAEEIARQRNVEKAAAAEKKATAELRGRFDRLATHIYSPTFAKLKPQSQQPALAELRRLGEILGFNMDDVDTIITQISPEAAARLHIQRTREAARKTESEARRKEREQKEARRQQEADRRYGLQERRFNYQQQRAAAAKATKEGLPKMTPNDRQAFGLNMRILNSGHRDNLTGEFEYEHSPQERAKAWEGASRAWIRAHGTLDGSPLLLLKPPGAKAPVNVVPPASRGAGVTGMSNTVPRGTGPSAFDEPPARTEAGRREQTRRMIQESLQRSGPPVLPSAAGANVSNPARRSAAPAAASKGSGIRWAAPSVPLPTGVNNATAASIVGSIQNGSFDTLMKTHPSLKNPAARKAAAAVYQRYTGRVWAQR